MGLQHVKQRALSMDLSKVKVASLTELQEQEPLQVRIGRKFVVLCKRGTDVVAMDDLCSHAHCFLSSGWLEDNAIVCPCHGAEFDLTTGASLNSIATRPLDLFPVTIDGDDVYIDILSPPTA